MRLFPGLPAHCAIGKAGPIRACRAAIVMMIACCGARARRRHGRARALAMAEEPGEVSVRGQQDEGFGRIQLQFGEPVRVEARAANGVMVIAFEEPHRQSAAERLAQQMPAYVSVVRHDPDGTGMAHGAHPEFQRQRDSCRGARLRRHPCPSAGAA